MEGPLNIGGRRARGRLEMSFGHARRRGRPSSSTAEVLLGHGLHESRHGIRRGDAFPHHLPAQSR